MSGSGPPDVTVDELDTQGWPEVDVIVVAHNGGPGLAAAVLSILASRGVRPNVVVVDNLSSDGSIDRLETVRPTVVRLAANVGYGAGFNAGLAATRSEWVACANQDIVLHPETLQMLIASATEAEEESGFPAIAGPRIIRPDGSTSETCHAIPSFGQECKRLLLSARVSRNVVPADGTGTPKWVRCGWVSGVFLVGRRETFEAVGGFDPDYFMYVEDLDLFRRVHDAGGCCVWEPRVTVVHRGGVDPTTRGAVSGEMYALTLWNLRRYFRRHEPAAAGAKGTAVLLAGVLGASMRAVMWSGRALRTRRRHESERVASDENASGMARMFASGAYLCGVSLVTGRIPKRVRKTMGRRERR
jgi:N-acetylglucosaminyl-diphospho-decaprenol L-rhamnosyltransferase